MQAGHQGPISIPWASVQQEPVVNQPVGAKSRVIAKVLESKQPKAGDLVGRGKH